MEQYNVIQRMLDGLSRYQRNNLDVEAEREMMARLKLRAVKRPGDEDRLIREAKSNHIAWRAACLLASSRDASPKMREWLGDRIRSGAEPPKKLNARNRLFLESRDMAICMTIQAMLDAGYQLVANETSDDGRSACSQVAAAVGFEKASYAHEIWMTRDSLSWPDRSAEK